MPKRLVFIEVDQEGKPVGMRDNALHPFFVQGYNAALNALPSASEALVEELWPRFLKYYGGPTEAVEVQCRKDARALLARVEAQG